MQCIGTNKQTNKQYTLETHACIIVIIIFPFVFVCFFSSLVVYSSASVFHISTSRFSSSFIFSSSKMVDVGSPVLP